MHNSYLGYYGPEWDKKIQDKDNPNFWKYVVANLVFLDPIEKSKKILDVGCGTGGLTLFFAQRALVIAKNEEIIVKFLMCSSDTKLD
jgi:tRNA1(Val) A37 N6-methylase TrmN6